MSNQSSSSPKPPRSSGINTAVVLIVAVAVVAVIGGVAAIALLVGDSSGTNGTAQRNVPDPTPTLSSPPPAGHTITTPPTQTQPTNLPASNCTEAPTPPANPQQFSEPPSESLAENATWEATITTNCGPIVLELNGKAAPQTVASFLFLAEKKFYDDVPCHRLTTAAQGLEVLQCGDPTGTGGGGPGYGYGIENAPKDGSYPAGTVAMARTADPNSNGSQFFIVYGDTTLPTDGGGYSIFGTVTKGLQIVEAVAGQGLAADGTAPKQPISILNVSVKKL
jgi:peptidyl-prolyl cis-trans isomerase B (cyclophilin B)